MDDGACDPDDSFPDRRRDDKFDPGIVPQVGQEASAMGPQETSDKASVHDAWLDGPDPGGADARGAPKKAFVCPLCHGSDHTVWDMSHPVILHWVINPGLAVNELLLGQRLPKQMYVCQWCPDPLGWGTFVHCPGCGTYSGSLIWSWSNGFGHWLGLVCPECGRRLPTLANWVTRAVSAGVVLAYRALGRPFEGRLLALQRGYLAWEWRRTYRARERIIARNARRARA
jgi:hypothetical protein